VLGCIAYTQVVSGGTGQVYKARQNPLCMWQRMLTAVCLFNACRLNLFHTVQRYGSRHRSSPAAIHY
jgi:hypothetical protein